MSVILTSQLNESPAIPGVTNPETGEPVTEAGLAVATQQDPSLLERFPVPPAVIQQGLEFAANAYATTYTVGFVLVLLTFIPIAFLPRKREKSRLTQETPEHAAAVALH